MAITWQQTWARIGQDLRRVETLLPPDGGGARWHPSFICCVLHRLSHYCHDCGRTLAARLFWQINVFLTGADISPAADLGGGLLIVSPPGASIFGRVGKNLTLMPCAGIGGEVGRLNDVGASPGLPWVGDDVVLEPHSGFLGPIRVGNRVRVSAGLVVTVDVPDDTIVAGTRTRVLRYSDRAR